MKPHDPLTCVVEPSVTHEPTRYQDDQRSCFQLSLDTSEITLGDPYLSSRDLSQLPPDTEQQSKVAQELERACQFACLEVHTLLLGHYIDERRDRWEAGVTQDADFVFGEKWNVGLLLLKPTLSQELSHSFPD